MAIKTVDILDMDGNIIAAPMLYCAGVFAVSPAFVDTPQNPAGYFSERLYVVNHIPSMKTVPGEFFNPADASRFADWLHDHYEQMKQEGLSVRERGIQVRTAIFENNGTA